MRILFILIINISLFASTLHLATSTNPARLFGMYPQKGSLNPGTDADIVLFDPLKRWKMRLSWRQSK